MPWIEVPDFRPLRPAQAKAQDERRWYTIKNATSTDEAEVLLYDEIGGWFGTMADQFVTDLKAITAPKLKVRVSSPGGSVFEGIAIANALRSHPAETTVQIDGLAASIASVIAMAGDRVVMAPNSTLMIHEASGACLGDSAEMQKMAEVLNLLSNNIADVYAAKAGGTRDEWRAAMREESWYLPEDALKAGLVDEVLPSKPEPAEDEPEEMHARYDLAAYGYAGPPAPKPAPPAVKAQADEAAPEPTLVISIADVLDEETVQRLREAVRPVSTEPVDSATVVDTASSVHHTATTDVAWDGPSAVAAMPNDEATLRYCHAWYDPEGDPDAKASYRFPHHKTKGGPANLAACRNGLARLEGSNIPDSEKAGVKRHLQAHLDDAAKADDGNASDTAPIVELRGEHGPEVVDLNPGDVIAADPDPEPEPDDDGWDAIVARLTRPAPNPWAAAMQNLFTGPASSSATES